MEETGKEIIVLEEAEHIRLRPTIYIGSVKPTDEKTPIIRNNKIYIEERPISVGMYKILNEAIDNSLDEAKRMKGKMKSITVSINTKDNSISVKDTGNGFHKGTSINKYSGKTNIETAVSQLRSGSNFNNDEKTEALIGTNGLGIKLTNVFSKRFKIITVNETHYFEKEWVDFESDDNKTILRKKKSSDKNGTEIIFEPDKTIFGRSKWDIDILKTSFIFKKRIIAKDPIIKNLDIIFIVDGKIIDLNINPFPENSFCLDSNIGEIIVWEKYEGSGSISFINSAMCTGIHQKITNDLINDKLEDTLGHHFYDTYISLNLPPKIVKFGDQNKTKFVSTREDIHGYLNSGILNKMPKFFNTDLYKKIKKLVDNRKKDGELKKIRKEKKAVNIKNSVKYFPAASNKPDILYIVEGDSAKGGICQGRDVKKEAIYALRGKIKNVRDLSDLSENKEVLELMQILNLDPDMNANPCSFDKIVIAADADPDGFHIVSLLINLFYRWFPWIIKQGKVYFLETPLVSVGDKNKKYYYTLNEYKHDKNKNQRGNVRYLKGLGSLEKDDWEYVMKNRRLVKLKEDKKTKWHLDMAFGKSSNERKKWLSPE